jgi:hypothetical protein
VAVAEVLQGLGQWGSPPHRPPCGV